MCSATLLKICGTEKIDFHIKKTDWKKSQTDRGDDNIMIISGVIIWGKIQAKNPIISIVIL